MFITGEYDINSSKILLPNNQVRAQH